MSWYVYILKLENNTYYTGITNNIDRRLKQHTKGTGSKYVRSKSFTLVYLETTKNRSEASKREYAIKQLKKEQKIKLIKGEKNEFSN